MGLDESNRNSNIVYRRNIFRRLWYWHEK